MFSSLDSVSLSVGRDPLCRHVAGIVADDISVGVILVSSKSSCVTVVAAVQDDLLLQVEGADENRPVGSHSIAK